MYIINFFSISFSELEVSWCTFYISVHIPSMQSDLAVANQKRFSNNIGQKKQFAMAQIQKWTIGPIYVNMEQELKIVTIQMFQRFADMRVEI